MPRAKAWETKNRLRKLTFHNRSRSVTFMVKKSVGSNLPALLINTSTCLNRFNTAAVISLTADSSLTSQRKVSTFAPNFAQAVAVLVRFFSLRATSAKRTPLISFAKTLAILAPIPWEAPVMRTTGLAISFN